MNDLLELVVNDVSDGAGPEANDASRCDQIGVSIVIVPILLSDEVVHVHQELWCCHSASELGRHSEHQIDELPAERV